MSLVRQRILTFFSLSVPNWRAIFWARHHLVSIDQSLRTHGLFKTKQSLLKTPDKRVSLFEGKDPKDIVRTIRRAARISIGHDDTCLRRSLLLWWILKQQGVDSSLRVGVASRDGELLGHAWVEIGQKPINDRANVRDKYQVIEHKDLH